MALWAKMSADFFSITDLKQKKESLSINQSINHACTFAYFQVMEQELLILLPDQSLTFSSADHFKYKVLKYVVQNTPSVIIIDGRCVRTIDATVAKVFESEFSTHAFSIH